MGICDFDYQQLFCDEDWEGDWIDHHVDAESWAEALVHEQCPICVALWQAVPSHCDPTQNKQTGCAGSAADEELDNDQLLDLTREAIVKSIGSWPFFRVRLRELASGEFLLNFQQFGRTSDSSDLNSSDIAIQNFLCYPIDDNEEGPVYIGKSTGSLQAFQTISTWVKQCDGGLGHAHCDVLAVKQKKIAGREADAFVPTRLLHVVPNDPPTVRLVADTAIAGICGPYTTLSHCWGDPEVFQPLRLLKTNLDKLCAEIAWTALPPTFQDAINVTRRLGVEYIWIDSLCIIQKDDVDWHTEAPRMERVYGNSYLNLAAVDSIDGRGGLFRSRRPGALGPSIVNAQSFLLAGRYKVVRQDFWQAHLLDMPLYRRGWVFQERMLAPRILHFSRDQIFWQCLSLAACESSPHGLHRSIEMVPRQEFSWRRAFHGGRLTKEGGLSSSEKANLQVNDTWKQAVQSYTSCNLTFSKDRLMALSGVANVLQTALNERYLAGLWGARTPEQMWQSNLPAQLGWSIPTGRKIDGSPSAPFKQYCAPSWSWASVDGVVQLRDRFLQHRDYQATIISVSVVPEQANAETGRVSSGPAILCLKGIVITVPFVQSSAQNALLEWRSDAFPNEAFWCHAWLDDRINTATHDSEAGATRDTNLIRYRVLLLAITINKRPMTPEGASGHGIIIRPVPDSPENHHRIGALEFRSLNEQAWQELLGAEDLEAAKIDGEHVIALI